MGHLRAARHRAGASEDLEVIAPPKDACNIGVTAALPAEYDALSACAVSIPTLRSGGGATRAGVQLIFILEQVLNGLLVGVYYLLIALGLSLIFSLGGIVNLAHGAFYAIGAYLASC